MKIDCKECAAMGEAPTSHTKICIKCWMREKREEYINKHNSTVIPNTLKNAWYNEYYDQIEPRKIYG